jgi:LysM repeat protein
MDAQHAIERGIAAARANKQRTAYYYFYAATQADPDNEQAWLWRASTAPQPRDALFCLAAVLAINPDNPVARHGIEQISAAVAAEAAPEALTITPSLSSGEFKPPERRLEWQQAFQRELYDMAQVPRMEPVDGPAPGTPGANGAVSPDVERAAYARRRGAGEKLIAALRRIFVDRDTQRVQFAIPVVIAVLLIIGAVAVLGWGQLSSPLPAANPTTVPTLAGGATTPTGTGADFGGGVPTATLVSSTGGATATQPAAPPATTVPASTAAPPATTAPPPPATTAPAPPATTAPAPPPSTPVRAAPSNTPVPAAPSNTPVPAGPPAVSVAPGQTLQQVAQAHNVSLGVLMAYNDIHNPLDVGANQVVKIPPADYKPTELQYTIRSGDNLTHISQLFNVSINAITQRNGMSNPNAIYAGQNIIIPLQ